MRRLAEAALVGRQRTWAAVGAMAVLTLLVSPDLLLSYPEIDAFDETKYIESGRQLLLGEPRQLTWAPLLALVYAPVHLVVGNSPDWFVLDAGWGRVILFSALLGSTYHLARQFGQAIRRHAILGVLFVSTAFLNVLDNPSDALLVVFSSLSLARLLAFLQGDRRADLALASLFLGLATLCRFEAIVLMPILPLTILMRREPQVAFRRLLPASLMPAAAVLLGFLLAFRLSSPEVPLGIGHRAYATFEYGQPLPQPGTISDHYALARELFGTAAENRNSILRAAARNPTAFAARLLTNLGNLPDLYLNSFGKRLGPALALFALWGIYSVWREGRCKELGLLALWAMGPLVSLVFYPPHIVRQWSGLILVLTSMGVTTILDTGFTDRSRRLFLAAALLLAAYGLFDSKLALVVVGVVLAAALSLTRGTRPSAELTSPTDFRGAALLLAAGLILRGQYPFPDYSPMGASAEEQVVYYLQSELPAESRVLETLPLPAVAARMMEVSWSSVPEEFSTPIELRDWLKSEDIQAVFLDERYGGRSDVVALLEVGRGSHFVIGYQSEGGDLRVFLPVSE